MPDRLSAALPAASPADASGRLAEGPLAAYRALCRSGALEPDPMQALAATKLQSLHNALIDYHPNTGATGWRARLGLARQPDPAPQGLYLFGGVGRGKSMLMDLFFATAPVERKRRVHFHEFMLETHERLHAWRRSVATAFDKKRGRHMADPIEPLARALADEAWLLCFDEFHVTDIADAMILGRLFAALFDNGVVVVATSNWPPDELYKDGLNRDRFLPFIALLKERLDVLQLESGTDYRRRRLRGLKAYHRPLGAEADAAMDRIFGALTEGATPAPRRLMVQGHGFTVPRAAGGVARFDFADLCGKPLGAADYLALAAAFRTILIDHVPRFDAARRDEARRFMTLIDALYEHNTKVVISAAAAPDALYAGGSDAADFQRTASRLIEMQSADYLASS